MNEIEFSFPTTDVPLSAPATRDAPELADAPPPATLADYTAQYRETVETALVYALMEVNPKQYFTDMARQRPTLYFRWCQAAFAALQNTPQSSNGMTINVITNIPRTVLDNLPPGFEYQG